MKITIINVMIDEINAGRNSTSHRGSMYTSRLHVFMKARVFEAWHALY